MALTKFKPTTTGWELAAGTADMLVMNTGTTLVEVSTSAAGTVSWPLFPVTPARNAGEVTLTAARVPAGLYIKANDPARAEITIWV